MTRRVVGLGCLTCIIGVSPSITAPATGAGPSSMPTAFQVLASQIVSGRAAGPKARVGGLSGLAYDDARREWLAISDDRQAPRWFPLRLENDGSRHRVVVGPPTYAVVPATLRQQLDFEAVVLLPDGDLLIACEGNTIDGQRYPTRIMRYRRDGTPQGEVPLPPRFLPAPSSPSSNQGLRDNRGFEGLTSTPDASTLWAIAEAPLVQDDEPASFARGALSRLLEFRADRNTYVPARELVYPLDRVQVPRGFSRNSQVNVGVADLTRFADGTLVSMERAFIRDPQARHSINVIRLYALHLEGADDVSQADSLRGRTDVRMIRKQLLLDLASVRSALLPRLATLDNFEAMAPGPLLLNERSMLLMSDDNFSATQVTAAILLRY